jgi:hypothetical protein
MYKTRVKVTLVFDVPVTTNRDPKEVTVAEWKKILAHHVAQRLDPSDWTDQEITKSLREYKILKTEKE